MPRTQPFRIRTAEGHEYDWHGSVAQLHETYPGAVITGRRVINAVGEGHYEPCSLAEALAAERKAAAPATKPEKPAAKAARGAPAEEAKAS